MAMLRGATTFETNNSNQEGDDLLEPRKPHDMPHSWV